MVEIFELIVSEIIVSEMKAHEQISSPYLNQ
jgi:hypothetical protein